MEGKDGKESLRLCTHHLSKNSMNELEMNRNEPKSLVCHIYILSQLSGLISHAQLNGT
jgi:hypothetical protein